MSHCSALSAEDHLGSVPTGQSATPSATPTPPASAGVKEHDEAQKDLLPAFIRNPDTRDPLFPPGRSQLHQRTIRPCRSGFLPPEISDRLAIVCAANWVPFNAVRNPQMVNVPPKRCCCCVVNSLSRSSQFGSEKSVPGFSSRPVGPLPFSATLLLATRLFGYVLNHYR